MGLHLQYLVRQMLASFAATLGVFGLGTVLAWTSPALPDLESYRESLFTTEAQSWIGSIALVGALASTPFAGLAVDKLGRRKAMLLAAPPFFAAWILIAFSSGSGMLTMILAGRLITGFCAGVFSVAAPMYIAETAQASIRGAMRSLFQLMLVSGILFTYVVGSFESWSTLALFSAVVPAVAFVILIIVPESPRFLIAQNGGEGAAYKSLQWLRNSDEETVRIELAELKAALEQNQYAKVAAIELLRPVFLKPIAIVLSLMIFEPFSGYDAVIFYLGSIFKASGSPLNSNWCSIIVGIVQVLATLLSGLIVDKVGRRVLLLLGQVFMAVPLFIIGAYFFLKDDPSFTNTQLLEMLSWLPVASLILFISSFSFGIGQISWTLLGELVPSTAKGVCSSLGVGLVWASAFVVSKTFTDISSTLGTAWCFWIYGICCMIAFVSIYLTVPETKGKSLEEIQRIFSDEGQLRQVN